MYHWLSLFTLKNLICFVGIYKSKRPPEFVSSISCCLPPPSPKKRRNRSDVKAFSRHLVTSNLHLKSVVRGTKSAATGFWIAESLLKKSQTRTNGEKLCFPDVAKHKLWLMKYLKNPNRQLAFDCNRWWWGTFWAISNLLRLCSI